MKLHMLATAAVLVLAPAAAFAQASTVGGAATGAVVGGVVGGPVGAVVGAGIGAGVGSAVEPPREVVTYVEGEQIPRPKQSRSVKRSSSASRCRAPCSASVPKHTEFRYAFVNKETRDR